MNARTTRIGRLVMLTAVVLLGACASPTIKTADGPIAADVVLLGETRHQRSYADYDWFLLGGIDKRSRFMPKAPFQKEQNRFHQTTPGRHTIYVRLIATAGRGLPGLRDDVVVFENVELDGGKAYIINGERHGEEFDVWIEDFRTKEHITTAIHIKPQRLGVPVFLQR